MLEEYDQLLGMPSGASVALVTDLLAS